MRIFEYQRTLLHQKVMSVDGVWCAIGSSNFDDRSFEINDEITLGIQQTPRSPSSSRRSSSATRSNASSFKLATWHQRGLWHRWRDNASYLLKYQL